MKPIHEVPNYSEEERTRLLQRFRPAATRYRRLQGLLAAAIIAAGLSVLLMLATFREMALWFGLAGAFFCLVVLGAVLGGLRLTCPGCTKNILGGLGAP